MEKGLGGMQMARHLMIATIYNHGTVSNADTWLLAESELKMSYFGGKRPSTWWIRVLEV